MKYIAKCVLRVSSRRPVVGSSSLSSMIIVIIVLVDYLRHEVTKTGTTITTTI